MIFGKELNGRGEAVVVGIRLALTKIGEMFPVDFMSLPRKIGTGMIVTSLNAGEWRRMSVQEPEVGQRQNMSLKQAAKRPDL
jgi:phage terminase large subunit GpA-like protein